MTTSITTSVPSASPSLPSARAATRPLPPPPPLPRCWCCWEPAATAVASSGELGDLLVYPPDAMAVRACAGCKDPDLQLVHQACIDSYVNALNPPPPLSAAGAVSPDAAVPPPMHLRLPIPLRALAWLLNINVDPCPLPPSLLDGLDLESLRRAAAVRRRFRQRKLTGCLCTLMPIPPTSPAAIVGLPLPATTSRLIVPRVLATAAASALRAVPGAALWRRFRRRLTFRRPHPQSPHSPAAAASTLDPDTPSPHPTLHCTRCTDPYSVVYLRVPATHVARASAPARAHIRTSFAIAAIASLLFLFAATALRSLEYVWSIDGESAALSGDSTFLSQQPPPAIGLDARCPPPTRPLLDTANPVGLKFAHDPRSRPAGATPQLHPAGVSHDSAADKVSPAGHKLPAGAAPLPNCEVPTNSRAASHNYQPPPAAPDHLSLVVILDVPGRMHVSISVHALLAAAWLVVMAVVALRFAAVALSAASFYVVSVAPSASLPKSA
ncbi:hypothetical protein HK405_013602 [Cladochytrium tenue]|nr:hypothetical protein HK405_013602 [Cladochytrium tenue]